MTSTEPDAGRRDRARPYTAAQTRVIEAAFEEFSTHGVAGTSLQMIADRAGITKASVYYQFKTKEQIVLAVAEGGMSRLEHALDRAEAAGARAQALDHLLGELVDLAIDHRHMVVLLQSDPVMVRLLGEHVPFRELMDRLFRILAGEGDEGRVPAAMLSAAIGGVVLHPLVADVDDDTLRADLRALARRFVDPGT